MTDSNGSASGSAERPEGDDDRPDGSDGAGSGIPDSCEDRGNPLEASAEGLTAPPEAPEPERSVSAERDKLYEQLLRTAADFDNFRKRHRRDVDDAERRGAERMLLEILPIVDNLERAVAAAASAPDAASVADGVGMVVKLFEDTIGKLGVQRMRVVGERFDPAQHDAVQQIETMTHQAGMIVAEIVPGYRRHDRILRPAMVVVARAPAATLRPPVEARPEPEPAPEPEPTADEEPTPEPPLDHE